MEKRVKCKKQYGIWYYKKEIPEKYGTCLLDAPIYHLRNEERTDGGIFGSYSDMKHYIETGENLG